jgi:predicted HTH domain antitoxin
MTYLNLKKPEASVMNLLKAKYKESQDDDEDGLIELAAIGFESRLAELYDLFQRGEISFEHFAELLKINVWEAKNLLEIRGLKSTNL